MLNSNRRQQIRRSIHNYSVDELSIKSTSTVNKALSMLSELRTRHQKQVYLYPQEKSE